MTALTLDLAKEILATTTTEEHLFAHAIAVSAAMGAMAGRFGGDAETWQAVGWLHDVDYEKYPTEHLQHTEELLAPYDLDPALIRAILAHGWGHCSDVQPDTDLAKCLYTVDELTGIIHAAARMRPLGITDLEAKSVMKKFKDKKFAAKCDRQLIKNGAELLGLPLEEVVSLCIEGMKAQADALGLAPREAAQ